METKLEFKVCMGCSTALTQPGGALTDTPIDAVFHEVQVQPLQMSLHPQLSIRLVPWKTDMRDINTPPFACLQINVFKRKHYKRQNERRKESQVYTPQILPSRDAIHLPHPLTRSQGPASVSVSQALQTTPFPPLSDLGQCRDFVCVCPSAFVIGSSL